MTGRAHDLVELTPWEARLCAAFARRACLGGRSHVRAADRGRSLALDQLVGQVGAMALSLWWYGSIEPYVAARRAADADPWRGDGGSDLPGLAVDVKASLMRGSPDPWSYRLAVRPAERHPGHVYVLGLVPPPGEGGPVACNLMGWARDADLGPPEADGVFAGACVVPAARLRPMGPDLRRTATVSAPAALDAARPAR